MGYFLAPLWGVSWLRFTWMATRRPGCRTAPSPRRRRFWAPTTPIRRVFTSLADARGTGSSGPAKSWDAACRTDQAAPGHLGSSGTAIANRSAARCLPNGSDAGAGATRARGGNSVDPWHESSRCGELDIRAETTHVAMRGRHITNTRELHQNASNTARPGCVRADSKLAAWDTLLCQNRDAEGFFEGGEAFTDLADRIVT